jgi:hypothetical protein
MGTKQRLIRPDNPLLLALLKRWEPFSEAPPVAELLREALEQTVREASVQSGQDSLLRVLAARFAEVPLEIATAVQAIQDRVRLERLLVWSVRCADLEAFRDRLPAARPAVP